MDASFAIQALCVEYLVENYQNLKPSICDVPMSIDNEVAKIALEDKKYIWMFYQMIKKIFTNLAGGNQ
ncbi:MAG: hypothetical protein Ct9H90mP20_2320 [Candidatus Neomarinimicrobiota bacterium]|nr:MAG: hypothetical protein Ct9H90mP20_2320 [Candidatus Neomarinimicrobiota bacterium]